jgi:hypothetical protein
MVFSDAAGVSALKNAFYAGCTLNKKAAAGAPQPETTGVFDLTTVNRRTTRG